MPVRLHCRLRFSRGKNRGMKRTTPSARPFVPTGFLFLAKGTQRPTQLSRTWSNSERRSAYHWTVRRSPSSNGTCGVQPRSCLAFSTFAQVAGTSAG